MSNVSLDADNATLSSASDSSPLNTSYPSPPSLHVADAQGISFCAISFVRYIFIAQDNSKYIVYQEIVANFVQDSTFKTLVTPVDSTFYTNKILTSSLF